MGYLQDYRLRRVPLRQEQEQERKQGPAAAGRDVQPRQLVKGTGQENIVLLPVAGAPVCKARTPPTRLLRPAAHPSGPVNIRYFAGSSFVTHLLSITAMLPEIPTRHKRVQPSYSFASFCCARTRSRWMNSPPYLPVDRLTQATRARSLHLSTSALLRLFPTGVSPARPPPYHHVFRYRPSSVSALSSSLESHLSKSPISYRRLCSNVMAIPYTSLQK